MAVMSKGRQRLNPSRGIALIVALLSLLVLSTLGMSLLFVTQTSILTSYNFKLLTQARYAAEAGSQSAVNWLVYSYTNPTNYSGYDMTKSPVQYNGMPVILSAMTGQTANYPDSTVQTAFNSALQGKSVPGADVGLTYSVTATLQSMRLITPIGSASQKPLQSWLIRSQGSVGGSTAQVEVTTTVERLGNSAFSYAAFANSSACGAVSFSNGSITDSFDSRVGDYLTTHQNSNGDIGSNGNISVDSSTLVYGNGSSPYSSSGTTCSAGSMTGVTLNDGATLGAGGNITMLTAPNKVTVPTPDPPSSTPPTTSTTTTGTCGTFAGCTTLAGAKQLAFAPGNYDNLTVGAGTTIHLSAGTYNINSLSVAGGSRLQIDSGPVILNIAGSGVAGNAVSFTGGSTITNTSGHPSDFQLVYGGSQPMSLMGGASTYGVVYAPNSSLTIAGGSDWYGSLIANTVTNASGTFIHYDRALSANLLSIGSYHVTSFSWSKY
jgi:Tfp pilus assembly protein PilX